MTTLPAHVSSSTTVSYKPDASDFEPDDEWKRQLLERIDKNMESMIQDARDSQAAQLRKAPVSHEERMRLEAEYKQAMSDIKKFATEQYKEELERERGQRRWAAGAPIHPDLNRLLQEEQQNIMNSIKQSADNSAARNAGESPTKERQPGGRTAPVNEAPHVEVPAQPPPPPPPPPQHQEDHDKASLPPPSRSARRPSDAKSTLSRDQDIHHSTSTRRRHGSTHVPTHERPSLPDTWIASDVVEEPEELLRSQSSRSKQPVDKPPATPDRWEGSLGRSSGSIRSVASDRSIGRSPPKPEVWKPTITPAEDSDVPKLYNLGRRGSTASMRSTGSGNSLRPSITETIPEKEDDVLVEEPLDTSERDNERIQDQEKRQSTDKMREKEKRPARRRESRPSPVDAAALRYDESLGPLSLRSAGSPSATMQYATSHLKPPSSNASSINREDRHHITDRPSKPPQPYLDTRDQHLPPREPPYLHRDSPYSSRDTPVSARSSAPARSTYANDDREYLASHGPGNRPLGPKSPFVGDHDYPSGPPSSVSHKSSFNYEDRRPHRDRDWERERDRDAHWEDDRDLRDRDYRERERERDMYPEGRHPGHYGYSGRSSAGYPTPPSSASRHGSLDYLPMNELYDDRDHPRYYRSAHDEWDYPPRGPPESGRSIPARRPSYRREREDPDRRIPADADNYPHYPPLSGSIPIPPRSVHDPEEPAWKGWGRDLHRQDSYVRSPPSTDHNPRRRPTHPPMVYHGDPRDNSPYGSPEVYRPRRRSDEDDDDEYDDGMESDREDGGAMPSGSGSEEDDIEEEEEEEEASKREVEARRLEAEKKAADEQIRLKELELKRLKAEEARLEAETLRREEEMRKKQEEVRKMEEEAKQKEEEFQKRELEALKMDEERKRKEEEVRKKVEDAKKKEKEVRKREQEAKRKADDAQKLEEEARRKEEEARKREEKLKEDAERTRRLQEEAKRITEEARVAQENLKRIEEETRKKEEEIRRREVALFAREEEVKRREAEAKKKEEETRRKEQQAKKLEEEDKRRAEEARQKVENAKLETAKQEEAKVRADRIRLEQENKRQQQEAERRRHEDELLGIDPRIVEEQQRLWNQVKREEEFRKRAEDIKRHREERKRNDSLGPESAWSIPTQPSPGTSPGMSRSPQFNGTSASDRNSGNSSWSSPGSAWTSTTKPTSAAPSTPRPPTAVPPAGKPRNGSVSSGTYPAPGTSPHAAGISEAEHMRRQAEFTNQQQEKFRREQERIEAERQMRAAGKPLSREDVQRAFEHHDRLWTRLPTIDELTWNDFPWPMLKAPSNPDDISSALISAYFQSPLWPDKEKSKTPKDRIKEHVRRWHPDRFETKVLPRVVDSEKEKVKSGAGNVARYLNDLLRKENENSSSVNIFGD